MLKNYFFLTAMLGINMVLNAQEDKYKWLEDIDGQKALEFVNSQNKITIEKLSKEKDYQSIYLKSLEIYNSAEKIALPTIHGKYVYNLWKDKDHERGIWRRSLLSEYIKGSPNWQTLIDIDELSAKDSIKWVFQGASGLYPSYSRFLVLLSNGGGDAAVTKEFDVEKRQFIENGFSLPEAKGSADYLDSNTIIVSTDFGEGTMTSSGYPRMVKLLKRGDSINKARTIFEGQVSDVGSFGWVMRDGSKSYLFIQRAITIFISQHIVWMNDKIHTLDLPEDCNINGILNNQLIIQLKSAWTVNSKTHKGGTLVSLNFTDLLKGTKNISSILEPDVNSSISQVSITKNKVLVNLLTNVTSQLFTYSYTNGKWINQKTDVPAFGTISIVSADELSDQYFFQFSNFIIPTSLYAADAGKNTIMLNKSLPAFFDASNYEVKQYKVQSDDGTLVPYFMISAKKINMDGSNPTLIVAYGGFEVSLRPFYLSAIGNAWLDKGGVFVLANIRGGGEFGPAWHRAGQKEKRQNIFNDLYAVSEDLISRKVASSKHLGVMGGSNGGLLVGVAFTQRPDLYNAVVCEVPLLDMQRYNKLLAGASWMDEYGNPDVPEEWEYLKKYSPYHNLKSGMNYPEVFFTTSTRDDRVHPGHARKMVAKMNDMGYKTYYYENTEGGHAGASTNEQMAKLDALTFSYLLMKLK